MEPQNHHNNIDGKRLLLHIVFWITYLLFFVFQYTFYVRSYEPWQWSVSLGITIWPDIIAAYFTNYFLLPRWLFKRKYGLFAAGFLLSALMITLLQRALILYIDLPIIFPEEAHTGFWNFNPFYTLINIYSVVAVFTAIKLFKQYFQAQRQRNDLEKQKKTSELALLKSQINPHFLFNTLNNIDALVATNQEKASDALIKLSDIMRYMLYDTATDEVNLEKEINYLESYIALQKIRLKQAEAIHFEVTGHCSGKRIAPMLFIPFVENAFKHGLKDIQHPVEILLECLSDELVFSVKNHYNTQVQRQKDQTKGIGLNNVKRRLELLYPGKYHLDIVKEDASFMVQLKIFTS